MGFPSSSVLKNPPTNAGDLGWIPGSRRTPEEGNGNPFPVFLPGKSHRQRDHVGYSPCGFKKSQTQLSEHNNNIMHIRGMQDIFGFKKTCVPACEKTK